MDTAVPPVPAGGAPASNNTSLTRSGGGTPTPMYITVNVAGTTDDVFMRRLNDTLDGLVTKYNGDAVAV
jgi:hypothetical protein